MKRRLVIPVLSAALLVAIASPATSLEPGSIGTTIEGSTVLFDQDGEQIDSDLAEYYADIRATFGLPSSESEIQAVLAEYGTAFEWGFPMTPEETEKVQGHVDIQNAMPEDVILGFFDLTGYAGFYFDNLNGGVPTLMLTDPETVAEAARTAVPADLRGMLVIVKADHSRKELEAAAWDAAHMTDKDIDAAIHRVAVNTIENRLDISVSESSKVDAVGAALAETLPVPVVITVEPVSTPETCTRSACATSEMKAGIRVDGDNFSTLGYAIVRGTDKQYVIAGHQLPSALGYSHNGNTIGSTSANAYWDDGIDARAIYASDDWVHDDIFILSTYSRDVVGTSYPTVGYVVYMSGISNLIQSGTIQDDYVIYSTDTRQDLVGGSANYYSSSGDSGGPVYRIAGTGTAYAVGIHSTGLGDREFARCYDFSSRIGATVMH